MATFTKCITTVDSHTAGESTRLVTSGLPPIPGRTMTEKLAYAAEKLPWLPGFLMLEPRGHRDMFGGLLLPPADPAADIGIVFMDNKGYEPMCGHGIIGATTCVLETGILPLVEPVTTVRFDTAAGPVAASACIEGGRVTAVTLENAPAFVYRRDVPLSIPELGAFTIDIAFGGNFFVLVNAGRLGLVLAPEEAHHLATLGMRILEVANREIAVVHPDLPAINRMIDLRFYSDTAGPGADSRNVVVLGDHMVDRSPCGTGTCAEMALRFDRGELALNRPWVVESLIGTRFTGELVAEARVGQGAEARPAVIPRVTGSAHITGLHQFLLDPRDPFPGGFAV